jgi:AraC-like DNA-binding protein
MTKKILHLLVFLFIYLNIYSQVSHIDNLKDKVIESISDSERITLHIAIAKEYITAGLFDNRKFNDSIIFKHLNSAYLLAIANNDISGQAEVLLSNADFSRIRENYDSLIYYAKKAMEINIENIADINCKAYFLISIGWKVLGKYDNAVESIYHGIEACKLCNNSEQEVMLLLSLCELYNEKKEYQKVIDLILPLKGKFDSTSNEKNKLVFFNAIAIAYKNTNKSEKALKYYNLCMNLGIVEDQLHLKAILQTNIGLLYAQLDSLDKALLFQNNALKNARKVGSERLLSGILIDIGETYLSAKKYASAIRYTKEGLKIAKNLDRYFIREGEHNLALAYEAQENYKMAYKHFINYTNLKDSLTIVENEKLIEDLQVRYQTKHKEEEIEKLSTRNQLNNLVIAKQRLSLFIGGIIIMFMIIIYFTLKKNYNKQKRIIELNYEIGKEFSNSSNQRANNFIDDNLKCEIIEKFEQVLNEEKIYKNPKVNLNDVANKIGTNRTYLSGIINDCYHENFSSLINRYRITDARIILINGNNDKPIKAIAIDLGFSSLSAFYRSFKSTTGITPAELRARAIKRS